MLDGLLVSQLSPILPPVSSSANNSLLTLDRVGWVLNHLGLIDSPDDCSASPLGGGVSSYVFLAVCNEQRYVVKQARPRLAVREMWTADIRRTVTEADAALLLAGLLPRQVPRVVGVDSLNNVLVMEAAPIGAVTWKELLLSGRLDQSLASEAGSMLARIHEGTRGLPLKEFADKQSFVDLRVRPYLQTVADRHPDLAGAIERLIEQLLSAQICFVHGDYSPKNLLVTPQNELMLIDHEVAHLGDPRFDLAFFLPHLTAKALREGGHPELIEHIRVFIDSYASESTDWEAISASTPALVSSILLARVDGKSPLEYLTEVDKHRLRGLARSGIGQPSRDLEMWVDMAASWL